MLREKTSHQANFESNTLGNTAFASQTIEDNAHPLLRTVLLARLALDVSDGLF